MIKSNSQGSRCGQVLRIAMLPLMVLLLPATAHLAAAATVRQQAFASPEKASEALAAAWHEGSRKQLLKIFGPDGVKLVSSGDVVAEKAARARLADAYDAGHRIERKDEKHAFLVIGKDEFPFPIPLVEQNDSWRFDTKAGVEEILDRRIGRNELNAIGVCRAYVESQREYASADRIGDGHHQFAMRIVSSGAKHDGLYWQAKEGEEDSPFGPLIASAAAEGYGTSFADMRAPYHGYFYKILTRQGARAPGGALDYVRNGRMTGGFALVAFPAKYGDSGIMTFIVNQDGIVFEKNLGPDTAKIARQMTEYNPDRTWKISRQDTALPQKSAEK
jgi:hypothetical protein